MATGFFSGAGSHRTHSITANQRSRRAIFLLTLTTTLLGIIAARLTQLQLAQGTYNRELAEQNRISLVPLPSDRGIIFDRKGKALAASRLTRAVYLSPREQTKEQWVKTAAILSPILDKPASEILRQLEVAGYRSAMPVRISRDLSPAAFIALNEKLPLLPGVEVQGESSRAYPHGFLAAHILGYVGEATAEDLKAHPDYPMGMIVGQAGIERIANQELKGVWGGQLIEVDARGKQVQRLGYKPAQGGKPVTLTVDLALQKTAESSLANRKGAVVVLDVKTGAVLAMASAPTFDPNLFTRRVTNAEWQRLQAQDKPFLNRALQGYAPGSTFKIVTSVAGIESGQFTASSTLMTFPALNLGGHLFHEHGGSGYGVIGFREALIVSSNTFFYQVGLKVGPEQISKWGKRLGIGTTKLGLDGESYGSLPTPAEKEALFNEPWYGGDTVSMSIGQGLVQVTPLEMAVMVAAIANGGYRVKPHLLASQTNTAAMKPEPTQMAPATLAVIREGLIGVVREGTARSLNDGRVPLSAGKTGTAEVPGQKDNSLYVGFAPADKPQIAVAIVVEKGGYGAQSAVPIAHELYKTHFGVKPSQPGATRPNVAGQ